MREGIETRDEEDLMDKPTGNDSFGWGFRLGNRILWLLLHVVGPAQGSSSSDPQLRTPREYERRRELHRRWKESREGGED